VSPADGEGAGTRPAPPALSDPARLALLRATELMDGAPDEAFDRWTRLAARLLGTRMAFVNLLDDQQQFSLSRVAGGEGPASRSIPARESVCMHALASGEPLAIPDTRRDARTAGAGAVQSLGMVAYLGVPLVAAEGQTLGTLCVAEPAPRQWTADEEGLLRELAAAVEAEIAIRLELRARRAAEEQLRESEERFRQFAEHIPQVFWMADPEFTRGLYVSAAHERTWGFPAQRWLRDPSSILEVVHPDDRERVAGAIAGHEFVERLEYRILRPGGEVRWLVSRGFPVTDGDGAIYRVAGITDDITDQKRADAALRAARDEAERANRVKSEFLSRMSHELRTPLNAVLGFAQLLEQDVERPDDRESVEQILRAGRHLLNLVDEVLDIARIESGTIALAVERVPLADVVRSSADLVRPLAAQRGIRLDADAVYACGFHVFADAQRLTQVLLNLLSNAIKYNREGGSVILTCIADRDRIRLEVCDTGTGIAPHHLECVFDSFERLGAERLGVEGAGLGLPLSRGLAQLMGGDVGARSRPGEGSTFWIDLPRARNPADSGEAHAPAHDALAGER
jgi:PAS domain S-box-containing protein